MGQKADEIFFVKVKEPSEVKTNLLELLKAIVENLQRFERFKEIREEKIRNVSKLRDDVKELRSLYSKFKDALPETKLKVAVNTTKSKKKGKHKIKKEASKKSAKKDVKKQAKSKKPKHRTELEKLESELNAIESRLSTLK